MENNVEFNKSSSKNHVAKRILLIAKIMKTIGYTLSILIFISLSISHFNNNHIEITSIYNDFFDFIELFKYFVLPIIINFFIGFIVFISIWFPSLLLEAIAEAINLLQDIKNNTIVDKN